MADQSPAPETTPAPGAAPTPAAAPKAKVASSLKRLRQSTRRRAMNAPKRTGAKRAVARVAKLIEEGDLKAAEAGVKSAIVTLDRAAAKGVLHPNNAARRKSRLAHRLHKAQAGAKS